MLGDKRLILGIAKGDGGQLWYRLQNPLRVLEDAGVAECPIVALAEDPDLKGLPSLLEHADLVIWQNPSSPAALDWIRKIRTQIGVPVAVDMDDHNLAVSPDNEAYYCWGTKPESMVTDPDGRVLYHWKDGRAYGEAVYDVARNKAALRYQFECLREATAVIASTHRLAAVIQRWKTWRLNGPGRRNVPVLLCPNMVDSKAWPSMRISKPSPTVRILWQGGTSHPGDLYLIRDPMIELLHRSPQAKFVVLGGPRIRSYLIGMPKKQVEVHESVVGQDAYHEKLAELDPDIGIAPLCDTPFNRCKSAVKYLQYTMLGIPTIASAVPPYSDNIFMEGDGRTWTGVLADEHHAWVDGLWQLVESPEMRFALARNARRWVSAHGDIRAPDVLEQLCSLYGGICGLPGSLPGVGHPARS